MYTLYGFPKTRSFRITWALEEMGLPYQFKLIDLQKGEHLKPPFSEINPAMKVPVLQCEQGVLSESGAILTYLADTHGQQEFIPKPATFERGLFEQRMYFLMTELEQPLWTLAKHTFVLPEQYRLADIKEVSVWEFQKALAVLATEMQDSEFVCGDTFSVADILATHLLIWARGVSLNISHANLEQYLKRLTQRPAYLKARQVEASVLPG